MAWFGALSRPRAMFNPGDKFDKYTIGRKLGEGGMGAVYLAKNPFGLDVVLKVLHPDLVQNRDVVERFRREGTIQYTLRHRHIVRVTDIVEQDGAPALVVDYMRGRDLEARLLAEGPLPIDDVIRISVPLLDALQTAHEHGFIHRDLKPANIFLEDVEPEWEPRLMDFGIAKVQEAAALTQVQEFCGTPSYASPEQIASTKDVSPLTDVYSFGVVMWSMCTAEEPYREHADDIYSVLTAVVRKPLPPLPPSVPRWLRAIIEKATAKDTTKRFQSAAEFKEAIVVGANETGSYASTVVNYQRRGPASDEIRIAPTDDVPAIHAPTVDAIEDTEPAVAPPSFNRTELPGDSVGGLGPRQTSSGSHSTPRATTTGGSAIGSSARAATTTGTRGSTTDDDIEPLEGLISAGLAFEANAPPEPQLDHRRSKAGRTATAADLARAKRVEESFRHRENRLNRGKILAAMAGLVVLGGALYGAVTVLGSMPDQPPDGFVRVEPGTFTMGAPADEPGRGRDEAQLEVTITRPFAIKIHEVTQAEWVELMFRAPREFTDCGETCPITNVSWLDAARYANQLSISQGVEHCYEISGNDVQWPKGLDCLGYRLPTEAEWEYASRAGTSTTLPNGRLEHTGRQVLDPRLSVTAWYGANSNVDYQSGIDCGSWGEGRNRCGPAPVGTKRPNPWGLYDMSGNVAEWVWDLYGAYSHAAVDPLGATTGNQRVVRGGSWRDAAERCRPAARDKSQSVDRNTIGFRVARTLR